MARTRLRGGHGTRLSTPVVILLLSAAGACAQPGAVVSSQGTTAATTTPGTTTAAPTSAASVPTTLGSSSSSTAPKLSTTTSSLQTADSEAACALLKPHFEVRGTSVFPRTAWSEPEMLEALSNALPLVPEEPTKDGRMVRTQMQVVVDSYKDAASDPTNRIVREITESLNWVTRSCFGMKPKFEPMGPGETIG